MDQEHSIPSESEWQIMEIIWQEGDGITSAKILQKLKGHTDMTERTIRVLLSRLCGKGLLTSIPDEKDSRVLHYHAACDRDLCIMEKSRSFIKSYFGGDQVSAIASFISSEKLSEKEIRMLEELLNEKSGHADGKEVKK